jgi:hypothetical protein
VRQIGIAYPFAVDSNLTIWQAFLSEYWQTESLIDASSNIRSQHFVEVDYAASEAKIKQLLTEAGYQNVGSRLSECAREDRGPGGQRCRNSSR